jgi:hypothetical protein
MVVAGLAMAMAPPLAALLAVIDGAWGLAVAALVWALLPSRSPWWVPGAVQAPVSVVAVVVAWDRGLAGYAVLVAVWTAFLLLAPTTVRGLGKASTEPESSGTGARLGAAAAVAAIVVALAVAGILTGADGAELWFLVVALVAAPALFAGELLLPPRLSRKRRRAGTWPALRERSDYRGRRAPRTRPTSAA